MLNDVKVYGFMMRFNDAGFQALDGIECMSYEKAIEGFKGNTPEEIENVEILLRSGDTARSFHTEEDGYTYLTSLSISEDRIVGEKEGLIFGYKFAMTRLAG